jgi:excisionase family DNA binding protein
MEHQTSGIKPNLQPTYTSVDALASDLGISRQSAYAALRRGQIPHIRIGKRFIIPRSAISEWLRSAGGGVTGGAR